MPGISSRILTPTFPKLFFSGMFAGAGLSYGISSNEESFASSSTTTPKVRAVWLQKAFAMPATLIEANQTPRLEEEFLELATKPIDPSDQTAPLHEHYLSPNENPAGAKRHFHPETGGIHVCTGTERLFSNAGMSPEREGFIGIDLDPQVIAYNHFNTLLLKISKDRNDYLSLAKPIVPSKENAIFLQKCFDSSYASESLKEGFRKYLQTPALSRYEQIEDRVALIRNRIHKSDLPPAWKDYYLHHLKSFADIYYPAKRNFFTNPGSVSYGEYHVDSKVFEKVQKYAKEGRLIFLKRGINDLQFLPQSRVRDIDVSNIPDYYVVGPLFQDQKQTEMAKTRIIWTHVPDSFFSWEYNPSALSPKEREELDDLISNIQKKHIEPGLLERSVIRWIRYDGELGPSKKKPENSICFYWPNETKEEQPPICSYTPNTLEILRKCPEK